MVSDIPPFYVEEEILFNLKMNFAERFMMSAINGILSWSLADSFFKKFWK